MESAAPLLDVSSGDTLHFFESVFEAIPPVYRQVDPKDQIKATKQGTGKAGKSLLDLHEHAAKKIKAEQNKNREKSLAKIAELTEQHKKSKLTKEEVKQRMDEDLSADYDEEKGAGAAAKEKKHVNKNTVAKSKADNKRA